MNLQKLAYISIIILTIYYISTDIYEKKQINDMFTLSPADTKKAEKVLKDFDKAQNNYYKQVDKGINFIQGTKKDINNLYKDFDNAKATFENKPKIHIEIQENK